MVSPNFTGENGEPVAMIARPSVHLSRSSGIASDLAVGFESGRMTGRDTHRAMFRTIDSVKAPLSVESPISTVGRASRTTSSRPILPSPPGAQLRTSSHGCA